MPSSLTGWSTNTALLPGDLGTEQTVALIRTAVHDALSDPLIRSHAIAIIREIPPQDTEAQARSIFAWVRSSIAFIRDPVGHETVQSARWTLTHGGGDCDDINAVLLPSLLGSVGIETRLVTVAGNPSDPSAFTHVYAEAAVGGRWVPLDAARPNPRFGATGSQQFRKRIWYFEPATFEDVALGAALPPMRAVGSGFSAGLGQERLAGPVGLSGMFDGVNFEQLVGSITGAASSIITAFRVPASRLVQTAPPPTPGAPFTMPDLSKISPTMMAIGAVLLILLLRKR